MKVLFLSLRLAVFLALMAVANVDPSPDPDHTARVYTAVLAVGCLLFIPEICEVVRFAREPWHS